MGTKTAEQNRRGKYANYLRKTGRGTRVPVAPVRAHLRRLHFAYGMTAGMLAERCTLTEGPISEIIAGRRAGEKGERYALAEIRRENAESVLKIEPEIPTERGGTRVNAIGTTRRVQGLAVIGYPVKWQGERIGFYGPTFNLTAQGRREVVYFSTAYKVRSLYEKLEMDFHPERHGIGEQSIRQARHAAERNGYVAPILWDWDTIDDPEGFPDYTGYCGTPTGAQYHRRHDMLPVCQPCLAAYNDYNDARKERLKRGLGK